MATDCIFCRVVAGEIPAIRVLETPVAVVFQDVNPQAPMHVLVVPRDHIDGFSDLSADNLTWNELIDAVQQTVRELKLDRGYRIVINSGADGGQTVQHLHLHILGGRSLQWPPG